MGIAGLGFRRSRRWYRRIARKPCSDRPELAHGDRDAPSAGMNYSAAKMLESDGKILIDPETGEEVLLKSSHSLFFIPIKYWTYVFGALAVLWFLLPPGAT